MSKSKYFTWSIHFILCFFFIGLLIQGAAAQPLEENQNFLFYEVQDGDWLAKVLRSLGLCPLWGDQGAVMVITRKNQVVKGSRQIILPGDVLVLPVSSLPPHDDYYVRGRQVFIKRYQPGAEGCRITIPVVEAPIEEPQKDEVEPKVSTALRVQTRARNEWGLGLLASWRKIEGTDRSQGGNMTLLTDTNYGLFGYFETRLKPRRPVFWYNELSVTSQNWNVSSDRNLRGSSLLTLSWISDFKLKTRNRLHWVLGGSYRETVFYFPKTFPTLEASKIFLPSLRMGIFISPSEQHKRMSFYGAAVYQMIFGGSDSNFDVEQGYGIDANVGLRLRRRSRTYKASLYAGFESQKTSILQRDMQELGLRFLWAFR